jgi:regulator of sigma E protease
MLLTLASLVVVLGVLISVHEFGHFIVAKLVGIQVLRFSLGFGQPVIQWRRGETEYWIAWIPLGGYVKMAGLEDEGMAGELEGGKANVAIDPERAFDKKPLWARMAVILAGVTMNVILAFVIYTGLALAVGVQTGPGTQVDTVLAAKLPPGTEALTALRRGDRIIRINGDTIRTWDDVQAHLIAGSDSARVDVAGRRDPIRIRLPHDENHRVALALWYLEPLSLPQLGNVLPNEAAGRAGLRPGDQIVRVNGDTMRTWGDLIHTLWVNPERQLRLDVVRGSSSVQLTVTPRGMSESDSLSPRPKTYGFIGAEAGFAMRRALSPGEALKSGAATTVGTAGLMLESIRRLVTGRASVKEVGGPITIARVSGQAARVGLAQFLRFLAFFSVSLAVLNLLPIPVLDGGHAMFLIAEGIRRRPVPPQLRLRLTQLGMLLVLAIMVLALSNDVLGLFR